MEANKYLWNPPKEECCFERLRTNGLSLKNFWQWKPWREIFNRERHESVVSRIDGKSVIEYIVYGTCECIIRCTNMVVKGIPYTRRSWLKLALCDFVNDDGVVLAYTSRSKSGEPNLVKDIQSTDLLLLALHDGVEYTIRENTRRGKYGIISQRPWVTIADCSGQDFMGAQCSYVSGIYDHDLVFAPQCTNNWDLLLGIVCYYACEVAFYRSDL
jgi:hypothetical protein